MGRAKAACPTWQAGLGARGTLYHAQLAPLWMPAVTASAPLSSAPAAPTVPVKLVRIDPSDLSQARSGQPSRPLRGDTTYKTLDVFSGNGGKAHAGIWEATAGAFRSHIQGYIEFCHIVEGSCRLVDPDGSVHHFQAGDSFVLPDGFSGHWEVDDRVKKVFVTTDVDAPAAA